MLGINVYNRDQHSQVICAGSAIWVGSEKCDDPDCIFVDDNLVQRNQLAISIDKKKDGYVELANHGRTVLLTSGLRVFRGVKKKLKLPIEFWIGESFVTVFWTKQSCPIDYCLNLLPSTLCSTNEKVSAAFDVGKTSDYAGAAPSASTLSMWFDAFAQLQRSVAGSHSFFSEAARCVFDPGGLDAGVLLLKDGKDWNVVASYVPNPELGTTFRPDLIERVEQEKVTLFHDTNKLKKSSPGGEYSAVVVSPVFDAQGHVTGVVYGLRGQHRKNHRRGVRPMEAHFVQLVAEAVSAGMIRLEREAEAARNKVLLNQAFSQKVVQHITAHPGALAAENREVTVLFADIRNFSSMSEKIGSRLTFRLLSDVMDRLTAVITDKQGVVIDYYGDGIAAFWNAPITQLDHAQLACDAALRMLKTLPNINAKWAEQIGQFLRIGIGINTGPALVGNSGSKRRIKYGPRGSTVNMASRIESATKSVGVPLLVSASTTKQLGEKFLRFNMGQFELPGFKEPCQLCRVFDPHIDVRKLEALLAFEAVVNHLESGDIDKAKKQFASIQNNNHEDPGINWLSQKISQFTPGTKNKSDAPAFTITKSGEETYI